jgi:branched-subunit amino acid aminotransferase/4-amino-4-deoxychorismate lyase
VTSKLNQILAELEADVTNSLSLMLDIYGNVAENAIANFFIVKENGLLTPPALNVLEGITRKAVFELSSRLKIPFAERNITLYDIAQAEEFFLTSSVSCVTPVQEVNGILPKSEVPGPITQRLMSAFVDATGFDFLKKRK